MIEFLLASAIGVSLIVAGALEYKAMKRRRRKSPEVYRGYNG